jgi:hypothetical protein
VKRRLILVDNNRACLIKNRVCGGRTCENGAHMYINIYVGAVGQRMCCHWCVGPSLALYTCFGCIGLEHQQVGFRRECVNFFPSILVE